MSDSWVGLKPSTLVFWLPPVTISISSPLFAFPRPQPWPDQGAQAKVLVLWLLLSSCCSCGWNSLWPLPLPALIPDLASLGSSSEARSQHHGNPTSLSNHRLAWQRQHCRQEWAGRKSRVATALRYTQSGSGQQLPASTSGRAHVHQSAPVCPSRFWRRKRRRTREQMELEKLPKTFTPRGI